MEEAVYCARRSVEDPGQEQREDYDGGSPVPQFLDRLHDVRAFGHEISTSVRYGRCARERELDV